MDAAGRSSLTPYAASKVANRLFALDGRVKRHYTEQTMYGYAKNGRIASNYTQWKRDGGRGVATYKVELDGDAFYAWMKDVVDGKTSTAARHDYDALADEFSLAAE
jgi:hypothetical protein